jgi:protocatechuate 3,4-dioxygenase beta subunit
MKWRHPTNNRTIQLHSKAFHIPVDRRRFFKSMAMATAGFGLRGSLAEALTLTPQQTQGPYYPSNSPYNNIPLDKDNDLVYLNDSLTPATGTITYISGRVLNSSGDPIRGALIELWHADANGNYIYSTSAARNPAADPNFAGFGQFLTGSNGAYLFRTIKAGLYNGRTRHMHFGITVPGQLTRFTTQLYWNEVPTTSSGVAWSTTNTNDSVLSGVTDSAQRASVIRDFSPVAGSALGEVATTWDIVMGITPIEPTYPGGSLIVAGVPVSGPTGGNERYRIRFPAYAGYSYEIYGNPTLGELSWAALPFSLSQTGTIDRNIFTASSESALDLFVEQKAVKGFYYVSFRIPGADVGTPGSGAAGGGPTSGGPGLP